MYGIAVYRKGTFSGGGGGAVVGLLDNNTTPGYTTLPCSALNCGNIALYCNDTLWWWWCGICGIIIPLQVIQLYSALS